MSISFGRSTKKEWQDYHSDYNMSSHIFAFVDKESEYAKDLDVTFLHIM